MDTFAAVVPDTGEVVEFEGRQLVLPGKVTPVSLELPENLTFEQWRGVVATLQGAGLALPWWLGDALRFGERKWGEMYAQAGDETGRSYGGLRNIKFVAERFPSELSRRRDNLKWSHYAEVAGCDDADDLLDFAARNRLGHKELRAEKNRRKVAAIAGANRLLVRQVPDAGKYRLIHAAVDQLDVVQSGSIDVVLTDPPYPREYLPVYEQLAETAERVLRPGGSCLAMVGQSYLPEILEAMSRHLTYHWMLCYLTPGGQAVQIWQRKVNTFWKPVLWFVKGEYQGKWLGDVAKSDDNDKDFHHWGQSESGMLDLVQRVSEPGDTILDPFCGGGTTGVAAISTGRAFIGADIDTDHLETSGKRLSCIVTADQDDAA